MDFEMQEKNKKESANKLCVNSQFSSREPSHDGMSLNTQELSDVASNIIIQSRIQYGSRWNASTGLLLEYTHSSSIHGIRYILSVHRPCYEKLYWLVLTSISFYIAFWLTWNTYLKWQNTPVVLIFDETLVPVHKIPFPTVTICPEIKTDQNIFNFANMSQRIWNEVQQHKQFRNYENFTEEELEYFAATLHICEEDVVQHFAQYVPQSARPDIARTLVDLAVSKNETGPSCRWNKRLYLCERIFHLVPTDEGICYQYNGLRAKDIYRNLSDISYYDDETIDFHNYYDDLPQMNNITGSWSLEEGYINQGYSSYPQRTVLPSARNGFFIFLQSFEHNLEYACRNYKQGYRVFLNSPESVPLTSGNYILVPHFDEVMVGITPEYVIADSTLREFSPQKRQCFFDNERYLRYFRYYSEANCQTECLINYTIATCGCAKFWMPKPFDVPVCEVADIACYTNAQKDLDFLLQNQTMRQTIDPRVQVNCNCMPSCTSLKYNAELSKARYDVAKTLLAHREEYEHTDFLSSRLSIYFRGHQFTSVKRTVLFSLTTFVANCGGIFGLFMGFSTLSLLELIYFFSLRLFNSLRKRRSIQKKMQSETEETNFN